MDGAKGMGRRTYVELSSIVFIDDGQELPRWPTAVLIETDASTERARERDPSPSVSN